MLVEANSSTDEEIYHPPKYLAKAPGSPRPRPLTLGGHGTAHSSISQRGDEGPYPSYKMGALEDI